MLVGNDRYIHMPELGNRAIIQNTGEEITIANPDAAESLLDLAINAQTKNRRIVFFCACPFQMQNGKASCHRYEVGSLLLKFAQKRSQQILITEWPGTEPQELSLTLSPQVLKKLRRGLKSLPLPKDKPLDHIASIAWGSVVHCSGDGEAFSQRVDRAKWSRDGWYLPVLGAIDEHDGVASHNESKAWGFFKRGSSAERASTDYADDTDKNRTEGQKG